MNRRPTLGARFAALALRLAGWKIILVPPPGPKFVAVVAPHTSNFDFWPGIFWRWATGTPARWVAKSELFAFPIGLLLRAWGGIAVNRQAKGKFVDTAVAIIQREKEIVLAVAPEGTRGRAKHWKTGFYYMALQAKVPIGIFSLDWGRKRLGIVGYILPTGDLGADLEEIRRLLDGASGYNPAKATPAS